MWAETILAILLIVAGAGCALFALLVIFGNAIGGVTNAAAVNLAPAIVLALLAVAGLGGGIALLL